MKKSIIALCCLILVIIYFAFFQIRRVDKVSLDGYVSSISIEDIASNLKSSKNVTINLETVSDGDYLYKNNSNYYIGEENKIDNDVTVIKTTYKTENDNGTIAIIGPKRMDYERVVSMLEYIKKNIER